MIRTIRQIIAVRVRKNYR